MFDDIKSSVTKLYIIMLVTLCFFIHSKQENGTTERNDADIKTDARKSLREKDVNQFSANSIIKNDSFDNRNVTRTDDNERLRSHIDNTQDSTVSSCNKSENGSGSEHTPGYCKLSTGAKQYFDFQVQSPRTPVLNLNEISKPSAKFNSQESESVTNAIYKNVSSYEERKRYYDLSVRKRKIYVSINTKHSTDHRSDVSGINISLSEDTPHKGIKSSDSESSDLISVVNNSSGTLREKSTKRFRKSVSRVTDETVVDTVNNSTSLSSKKRSEEIHNRKKTSSMNILRKILQQKVTSENEDRRNSTEIKNLNDTLNKIIKRRKPPTDRKLDSNNSSEAFEGFNFDKNPNEHRSNNDDFVGPEDALVVNSSDTRNIAETIQDSSGVSKGFNITLNTHDTANRNNFLSQSSVLAKVPSVQQDSNPDHHMPPKLLSVTVSQDNDSNTAINKERQNKPAISVGKQSDSRIGDKNRNESNKSSDDIKTNSTVKKLTSKNDKQALLGNKDHVTWPVKLSAEVVGDLILGGLMMVHEREDTITCGPIMPQGGIQALETMLYTLDVINSEPGAPFTIGAHILDDCDKDTYGLEMAVDFIKGSISNIDGAEYHCNKTQVRKVISGVIGAASSVTSIQVANLLRLFKIPQVSFFSTSPELSNKQRFEYFSRTIPSDHYQVKAMVEIVRRLGWSYVSIIYEESNYGIKAFEELESLLAKYDICIAVKEKLVKDSGVAEETAYDNIVLRLQTKPRAKGAIIFGSDQEVAGLMRAVRRCNATGSFSWIGSDGWSARSLVWQGSEAEVEGTLSVQPQANPVRGFDSYFLNLTVENNKRNPWFVEFWEDHFQCRYPNSTRTPYNLRYARKCSTKEQLTRDNTAFENQLQFVSDAVMAFVVALRDMHSDLCHGRPGLCDSMRPTKGTELLKYLRRVNFEGLSGDKFHFDANGDGPARYNIIHFKQISEGEYRWVRVGEYIEGELKLNMSEIQFKLNERQPPESVCSLPCDHGQAKKYVEGESCCWHCFNCTQYQIRHLLDETQCVMCREGTVPDSMKQVCLEIPEVFLRVESAWAICAMSLSATGMLVTLFVVGVFLRHNDTPVVKAAGRELSYVLLTGILLCYLVTFALVLRPTDIVCGIQRFGTGFCFTVVYAALFTKTNRIARIFNASKRTVKQLSFISPKSQLIICCGLVSIQVLINAVWMVVSPPRAIHHYPTREDNLLVCASYVNASYMIAFGYPIVLILICTVYAVLTRNIPEAFNESKHIGFTMYTTCVIWLAFVPLYFGTGSHMPLRITSMSVTISLSASVTLVCLFSPKLYIILIRPERNVRQSMMPSRHGALKSGTTASVMVGAVPVTHTTQPFAQVLGQHENIALELNNEKPKAHKHHGPVQTATKSTQTQQLQSLNNKSPTAALVNNVVNNITSVVSNGPPVYDIQH